jgi:hypothetical protein
VKDWQNLLLVILILAGGAGLLIADLIDGKSWTSMATLLGGAFILGEKVGILATGWSVQAQAKAAATVQQLRAEK